MPERWTQAEIAMYARAVKLAPKQKEQSEKKRLNKLDELFDKLHGVNRKLLK